MIVKTKLHIPRVPKGLVDRTRLMDLLDEGMEAKLTLVTAPAGYGKTTALSQWARRQDKLAAWVSLGRGDDDWVQFWSYVTAAIQERIPGYGHTVWPLIERGPSASSVSTEPAMAAKLRELDQISGELAIVLDDLHLIEDPAIYRSLSFLLEYLPPHVHFYLASRAELPFPTARILAKGDMRRITMQDLRFQSDEGVVFFRDAMDFALTRRQVAKLCHQTEGWISGLQLAAISLRHSDNVAESIRQFSGHQHDIARYLLEEVFQNQPEEMRHFMLRTSILSRMNHSLCQAVTGQANVRMHLERLERDHLFVIPLDDQGNWYRYHHLLSSFLQRMLSRQPADEVAQVHVRAARWLETHDFVEDAAEHYLSGQHYEDVVRLMETHLSTLIHRKIATISRWILQVPERFLIHRPRLEVFYCHLLFATRQWSQIPLKVEQVLARYETQPPQMHEAEWKPILGDLYAIDAVSHYIQKDLERAADGLIRADRYLSIESLFIQAGYNKHFGLEEFDDPLGFVNDYHRAAAYLQRMMKHWQPGSEHPYAAPVYASYTNLLYEWDRLEEAEACISQFIVRNEQPFNPRNLFHTRVAAARVQQGLGNPTVAQAWLEQLKLQIDSPDYALFMRKIEAEQGRLYARQGDYEQSKQWLQRCGMAYTDQVSLGSAFEYLAFAEVLAACDQGEEALALTDQLIQLLEREDRLRDRTKAIILQSVLLFGIGQQEKGILRLETSLRLAQPQGFIRSFVDQGHTMAQLLSAYVQGASAPSALLDYARRLLQAFPDFQPHPDKMKQGQVRCFGRFDVEGREEGGGPVKWRTAKTEELMAYLIHHRGDPVSRDLILDSLWGDVDMHRASAQLNTTVYYLRQNLSAVGLKEIVKNSRGYYRIQVEPLDCDYDEFRQMVSVGIPAHGGVTKELDDKLAKLYRTGYLSGHDYPWAEETRTRLESEYVKLLLQIHDRYLEERAFSAAALVLKRILELQPFNEEIHARLIHIFVLAGDRVSAKRHYEFLKDMLQTELGVEPKESVRQWLHQI